MIITVCSECYFKDIQNAINFSKDGDKIIVKSGIYRNPIIINKSIELIANGEVILDGEGKYQIITILASNVKLEGFIIKNSGTSYSEDIAAIKLKYLSNCVIKNNKVLNNFFAIYLERVKNCIIENNVIIGFGKSEGSSGNGIHAWDCESLYIYKNYIKGHRDGIYLEFVRNSRVSENISEYNLRYGLHLMFSNENLFIKNKFYRNGAGVAIMYSKSVDVTENIFERNSGQASYGFLLKNLTDSKVYNNEFINNTYGIYLEECNRIIFKENLFKNNGWAIRIYANSENNLFEKNLFLNNAFDVSTNTITYFKNTFLRNYWDNYQGYDLNRDNIGDIPYRPVSFIGVIFEKYPISLLFYNSFLMLIIDLMEKVIPIFNQKDVIDSEPLIK
ncbi:MAG: nitrous oxide reductase family maturation protein NosD [candidate division WOR-3 bacterium]